MKNSIVILFVFGLITSVFANNPAYLYVSANSGLNLRTSPVDGHIIKKLHLGDRVEVKEPEECWGYFDRIEWVDGNWIEVSYDGYKGYVFSGFLTDLPIPLKEGEYTKGYDLSQCFFNYLKNNFTTEAANDTLLGSNYIEVAYNLDDGKILKKIETPHQLQLKATLEADVMEMYHIFFAMLANKDAQRKFVENTIVVQDKNSDIAKVSILADVEQVVISKSSDDYVSIKLTKRIDTQATASL